MKISQREAQRNLKELRRLQNQIEQQRNVWASEYPNGVGLGTITWDKAALICEAAFTGRKLGHAVVCVPNSDRMSMSLFALPEAKP